MCNPYSLRSNKNYVEKRYVFFSFQFRFKNYSADAAFTFTDSAITATGEGSGYEIDGTHITIEASGTYLLSGECSDNGSAENNDAINAQQLLNIKSGTLSIAAGDDAAHSDLVLNIGADDTDGPTISIAECCEGLEASELNDLSGDITILSSDDCMNAANSDLGNYDFVINISGSTQPDARPGGNMGDMQPPSGEPGGQKPDGEPPAKPE